MNKRGAKEHKNGDIDQKGHQSGVSGINSVIDDQGQVMTKEFNGLTICLKPEDDFPHPRHLCFRYPFDTTSPIRYCNKCYCYVCEELAPCKKWNEPPQKHCQATEKDESWILQRQRRPKLPGSTLKLAHHKLVISACFESPNQLVHGFAGGLVCNGNGDWIFGFSMHIHNNIDTRDPTVPAYNALVEGLQLVWSQGFRFLDIYLGYAFRACFWIDFAKDATTRKFHICADPSPVLSPLIWTILKDIEGYLNREWFIDVKRTTCFEEEAGSLALAGMADEQAEAKKEYDFKTYPDANIRDIAQETKCHAFEGYEY